MCVVISSGPTGDETRVGDEMSLVILTQVFTEHPLLPFYPPEGALEGVPEAGLELNGSALPPTEGPPGPRNQPNTALLSLILMLGTFLIAFFLRKFRNSRFLGGKVCGCWLWCPQVWGVPPLAGVRGRKRGPRQVLVALPSSTSLCFLPLLAGAPHHWRFWHPHLHPRDGPGGLLHHRHLHSGA